MTKLKLMDLRSFDADLSKYSSYLCSSEKSYLESIQLPKRARQWLGGRIAAKYLIQKETGLSLEQIVIEKDESKKTKGALITRSGTYRFLMQVRLRV